MELFIDFLIHFLFFVGSQLAFADQRNLQFQQKSPTGNLFGVGCAIDKFDKFQSRGVRFNPLTRACESLHETWFTNQIEESGFIYYQLRMAEDVFQPTDYVLSAIPAVTLTEFSVVVFFNSGYNLLVIPTGNINQVQIDFLTIDQSEFGFHLGIRTCVGKFIFNTYVSGIWGREIHRPVTVTNPNTIYKFEGKINPTFIQVYIDDVHVLDFPHQTAISNYQLVNVQTIHGAEVLHVQFYS